MEELQNQPSQLNISYATTKSATTSFNYRNITTMKSSENVKNNKQFILDSFFRSSISINRWLSSLTNIITKTFLKISHFLLRNTIMAKLLFVRILMVLAATAMLVDMAVAVNHTVGSPNGGWDLSTNLSSWAASQTFSVGDNLDFQFDSTHDVLEVTRENYDSCGLRSPISTTVTSPARFQLTSAGNRYFICGRGNHCSLGMRVRIDVSSTPSPPPPQSTPPPASTPPPPPQSTPPPAPTPSPTPQTTPPSPTPTPQPQTTPPSPTPTPPQTTPPSSLTPPANDPSGSSPPPPISGETADPPSSAITLKMTAGSILGFGLFVMMLLSL